MSRRHHREESGASMLVNALIKKGIKLVAVDFDQTFIKIHSGGVWKDSTDKLIEHIRPCIRELVEHCLDRGIHVCIVTYFSQPWVIKEMLLKVYRKCSTAGYSVVSGQIWLKFELIQAFMDELVSCKNEEVPIKNKGPSVITTFPPLDAERILVQANTAEFREKHNHEFLGKEAHITSILTKLYNTEHLKIRPEEVILFDDDKENTNIAIQFGHMAFIVQDSLQDINFEDFAKTINAAEFRKSWVK